MAEFIPEGDLFFTQAEPKVKFRYIMYIDGIAAMTIHAAGRPSLSFEPITIDHINMKYKVAGKSEWQPINLRIYEFITPSTAQSVMGWVRRCMEWATGAAGYQEAYKQDVELKMLGPAGDIVESWVLKGAWASDVNFGDLDWSTSDIAETEITLTYDYAINQF